ncbi:YnbE-like lipoprotein [Rhodothalassium salexigens DSM 2132]|uniref:YnbE-like lipoprotein n=1 Tax=Rhodothalassium salexigens DSM 2132 TaxID=1188247 RepID=A0A4R2PGE7_RHOSA|nr:YnbE family lipoprotein [Rhodothalassium salexigens]MBB4211646.1 hypothetical protein [Rhodothalassium salexigens DSM 2132]MBK1639109.1 hypothetical protein [Rhodothalassium salexigens DSM 2132]TCP34422.1 YnbE-like lipoprotein [Rhodothalassium salexigens DSM 2132]
MIRPTPARFRPGRRHTALAAAGASALLAAACTPSVKLQAPDEPIRFDVNVNITEQKRLEIDKELLDLIKQNPALFGVDPADLPEPAASEPNKTPTSGR